MNRLTAEERRRVYLARQRAQRTMLDDRPRSFAQARASRRTIIWALTSLMIGMLMLGGLSAAHVHISPPASLIEALLPRL
jgi:hypothetical protein